MHYQNRKLCRVPRTLPSFFISGTRQKMSLSSAQTSTLDKDTTLGKATLCRVLRLDTRQRRLFAECRPVTLGKDILFAECQRLTLGKFWPAVNPACRRQLFAECTNATLGKEALCRVSKADTRQSIILFTPALQKISPLHITHVVLHA